MHTRIMDTACELIGELDKNLPPKTWRQIMQVFIPIHIADSLQIQQYVGLECEKFRRGHRLVTEYRPWVSAYLPPIGSFDHATGGARQTTEHLSFGRDRRVAAQ